MVSPYARSKQALEAAGYLVGRTEHFNTFIKIRQDLFGIIDMVCVKIAETGVLGVNPTSGANVSAHIKKAAGNEALYVWLRAGNRFEIHGWRKVGERGKRKVWECRIVPVTVDLFGRGIDIDRADGAASKDFRTFTSRKDAERSS